MTMTKSEYMSHGTAERKVIAAQVADEFAASLKRGELPAKLAEFRETFIARIATFVAKDMLRERSDPSVTASAHAHLVRLAASSNADVWKQLADLSGTYPTPIMHLADDAIGRLETAFGDM